MPYEALAPELRTFGRAACWAVFFLNLAYFFPLTIGLLTLKSPLDPISDPYITIMEVLILLMVPFMVASMVAVYYYAPVGVKPFALAALAFMALSAGLTACVHFSILTVGRQFEAAGLDWAPRFFAFRWPSVVYALDYHNIGVVGYAIVAPVAFLLMGILFGRIGPGVTQVMQSLR